MIQIDKQAYDEQRQIIERQQQALDELLTAVRNYLDGSWPEALLDAEYRRISSLSTMTGTDES